MTTMQKLYFRDADGNVSEHELFAVDAHHALTFPHEWSKTPDGFKDAPSASMMAKVSAPAPAAPVPAAEPATAPDREPAPDGGEPPAGKKAKS